MFNANIELITFLKIDSRVSIIQFLMNMIRITIYSSVAIHLILKPWELKNMRKIAK